MKIVFDQQALSDAILLMLRSRGISVEPGLLVAELEPTPDGQVAITLGRKDPPPVWPNDQTTGRAMTETYSSQAASGSAPLADASSLSPTNTSAPPVAPERNQVPAPGVVLPPSERTT